MKDDEKLLHFGTKRHSGRYPWGSGEEPAQSSKFLNRYYELKNSGMAATDIAKELGMNTRQLRDNITWANKDEKERLVSGFKKDREAGLTNTAIGKKYGVSEATVRNYLSNAHDHKAKQSETVSNALKKGVERTGYLDVGVGVEIQIGVPRTRFNNEVNRLVSEEGYYIHEIYARRLSDISKPTTIKVLTKEPDVHKVSMDRDKIRPLDSWSEDRGETIANLNPPKSLDPKVVKIRYKEEGGNQMDGIIQLRPGVEDLDMGNSHYAQVRIKVGEDRFLKGMAVYGDPKDFPPGTDVIFNTNKPKGTDFKDVLKKTKEGTDNEFGSTIVRQNASNVLNIVNEEGEWDTWSTALSSQFLSKQPDVFVKERLDATHKVLQDDLDEIKSINNPLVKDYLLESYSNSLNTKAAKLKAEGLPKTKSHVILPFPDMNPNEIYAPNYEDGETVVLLRYPHGGIFELPEVKVNNKNPKAKKVLGVAPDAIGIHPSVAEKLSGADFDGDTVYVIPNNSRKIKTSRTLKELKNFDPMDYKVNHQTINEKTKNLEMGKVSNLITDMTIKGAPPEDIARAVRHSMVVIDSYKHQLNYQQSAIDNGISALKKRYQSHINPDTGKPSIGAATLISRSKRHVDITQGDTARQLLKDIVKKDGTVLKKGMSVEDVAKKLQISKATVERYAKGGEFDPFQYSSGTKVETLYAGYIAKIQKLKVDADSTRAKIKMPTYDKDAAKLYKAEVESLNKKLIEAKSNAPRERQAQILSAKLYYSNLVPDMTKDQKKKLKHRSLARARVTTGADKSEILITDKEWSAIQARALSNTKVKEILMNSNMDQVRKLATPRKNETTATTEAKAKALVKKGYTYDQVAKKLGVSSSTVSRTKLSTAKATRAKSLIERGLSYEEAAKALGVSVSAVQDALKQP